MHTFLRLTVVYKGNNAYRCACAQLYKSFYFLAQQAHTNLPVVHMETFSMDHKHSFINEAPGFD